VFGGLHRTGASLGVGHHRSKLERVEHAAAPADPVLPEENRTTVLDLDCGGDRQRQRRRDDQTRARQRAVEQALHHAATPPTPATGANRSRYARTATRRSYCHAARRACSPIARAACGSSHSFAIAAASASGSPGAATTPHPSRAAIVAGSQLGSVAATYGRPAARMPYSLLGTMNPSSPAFSDTTNASAAAKESCSSSFG